MPHILLIEDNTDLAFLVSRHLQLGGHEVDIAQDAAKGIEMAQVLGPDLVVLDLMLPDADGFDVLRALRQRREDLPILILTARSSESDKVLGLRGGADDYVIKPCGALELLARVDALIRRARAVAATRAIETPPQKDNFGDVLVNRATREIYKNDRLVALTPKGYDLLVYLLAHHDRVVTREELLDNVWNYREGVETRTLDTHVAELRRKLEDAPANPQHIMTVRKIGFRLLV